MNVEIYNYFQGKEEKARELTPVYGVNRSCFGSELSFAYNISGNG
jgi:hypothetical protein